MIFYPCTKNPPCTNVSGHRTPVCPNNTSSIHSSVSKLKAEAVLEHKSVGISHHPNGNLSSEQWEPGKGPGGLLYSMYSSRQNPDSLSENDLSKGVFCF